MISTLGDPLDAIESRRRRIDVYATSPAAAAAVAARFRTKNVTVNHEPLPPYADEAFLVLRDDEGEFLASLGRDALDRLLSPDVRPPWDLAGSEHEAAFDFLENTLFTSFDRTQMLATAREIEERAWRVAEGTLYVGFQRVAAFEAQAEIYEHLADRGDLSIRVFLDADWAVSVSDAIPTTVSDADEIGDFWFLVFDGAGRDVEKCALIAEEREPGSFYGFWTYDAEIVDDVAEYLEAEYGSA